MKKSNGFLLLPAIFALLLPATAGATQQAPVALGSNSTFVILAATTVTVTGGGSITGNIGISPGTAYVAGVPAVTLNGTLYAGGPVAAQAQADLTTAFNDAAGRQTPVIVAGNIGGQTLTPGLYKSTSSLAVSSGDLTLDAQGNSNAVFIFQIASTLTLTSGRQVILAGNANPANIFWQVGTSATLGTTSVIHGNILAAISISALTGSVLDGRALAQGGAVTVDTGGGNGFALPVTPTAPTVTSTVPLNNAIAVPIGNRLSATFSTAMNPATLTIGTFSLMQGAAPVSGSVSYSGVTATFTPNANLAPLTLYTATITTGATDTNGTALASNYVWRFTTGAAPDLTPPVVISTVPSSAASGVATGNRLSATFSKVMDPLTITNATFLLMQGVTAVPGAVNYSGTTATFAPTAALATLTTYTATITTGVRDLAGNALAASYVWMFTTGSGPDITPPTVISTVPAGGAGSVATGSVLTVTFSEPMDPLTINTATVTLQQALTTVAASVTYSSTVATLTPATALSPGAAYTGIITTGTKDLAGNALAVPFIWNFTTAALPPVVPPVTPPVVPPVVRPVITVNGTVNEASFVAPVVAGSIAAVFGSNLATSQSSSMVPSPLPTILAQSTFNVGGQTAPLYFVSPGQVNLQIPWELAGQTQATIDVNVNGVASDPQTITLAPFMPGIFSLDMSGRGQGAILVAPTAQLAAPGNPVLRGGYIAIFCTGLGVVSNRPATGVAALSVPLSVTPTTPVVMIGGVAADVSYSGLAPTLVGLYQVNAHVPAGVTPGNAVTVVMSIGGATSNTVTIAVQ